MKTPLKRIYGYAIGDGAVSLSVNGINNFALLYYTQVLGLGAGYAGLALSITLIWDAVTDPIMGHVSDATRSKYGRRHPFMLIGGGALAVCFFFLWWVPESISASSNLFWYLLAINLMVRTAITVFTVPFIALGFEICTDYDERSKLQGIRFFLNQIVNFAGGALAWVLFFTDETHSNGTRIDGTKVVENYLQMGSWLTGAIAVFVVLVTWLTRQYAIDNRNAPQTTPLGIGSLYSEYREIISDRLVLLVASSRFILQIGTTIVAQVQMFAFVEYLQFSHTEKTIAHGSGMLAFAAGSLFQDKLVKRFDKKPTALLGVALGFTGNLALLALFVGGLIDVEDTWTVPEQVPFIGNSQLPLALIALSLFQSLWWGGMGLMAPLLLSMIADISEINYVRRGKLRDGGYTAVFSLSTKAAMGIGMLLNGWLMTQSGYLAGAQSQTPETLSNLALVTFTAGPIALLLLLPFLIKYPITRSFMQKIKQQRLNLEKPSP